MPGALQTGRGSWAMIAAFAALVALALPGGATAARCDRTSTALVPLDDLGRGTYFGSRGGLYPGGRNLRPRRHEDAGQLLADGVVPRDAAGAPDESGRYALVSIGMSNTTQEFQQLIPRAMGDRGRDRSLAIVDGAQGGATASRWADPGDDAWRTLDSRLAAAGISPQQVAVAWVKLADAEPTSGWPAYAQQLQAEQEAVVRLLRDRFPRLDLVYLSSRIYAGYASTSLNPEPYAYESGFAVKWLIQDQLGGDPALNWDPEAGPVEAPWLAWGPYLWADGLTPRASDGLTWACAELAGDGTHPSAQGAAKVATRLHDFFRSDTTARLWFNAINRTERDITVHVTRRRVVRGEVEAEDGFIGCVRGVRVDLWRRRNHIWDVVNSDQTDPRGKYRIGLPPGRGPYEAKARHRREGVEDEELCGEAKARLPDT